MDHPFFIPRFRDPMGVLACYFRTCGDVRTHCFFRTCGDVRTSVSTLCRRRTARSKSMCDDISLPRVDRAILASLRTHSMIPEYVEPEGKLFHTSDIQHPSLNPLPLYEDSELESYRRTRLIVFLIRCESQHQLFFSTKRVGHRSLAKACIPIPID